MGEPFSLFQHRPVLRAVDDVSFSVSKGATLGIVGESGSGKSTTANALMRLVPLEAGRISLGATDVTALKGEELRRFRKRFQMIFQDPFSSLNPRARAGAIVREPLDLQDIGSPTERNETVKSLFSAVGLRPDMQVLFPHQFSGGQRQRIAIARALATAPELIICDEPVSALDVAVQAQVLNLLRRIQAERELTYIFISHDLGVVRYMSDEVAVMYLGKIVEIAESEKLFKRPLHPYTRALLASRPSVKGGRRAFQERVRLQGEPASFLNRPSGCAFSHRCPFVESRCRTMSPVLQKVDVDHSVSCHLVQS
jgi:peptide/nickel transport system ATP-binding protein